MHTDAYDLFFKYNARIRLAVAFLWTPTAFLARMWHQCTLHILFKKKLDINLANPNTWNANKTRN